MEQEFEIRLIECLDALEHGEPLDIILSRYPEDAAQLRPLLQTAVALPALQLQPLPIAQAASRRVFLSQAALLREQAQPRRWRLPIRLLAPLVALVLLVALFGQLLGASAAALPGDMLYPLKRTVEHARLALATDRDGLSKQFEQERLDEIAALLSTSRTAEIEFAGLVEMIGQDSCRIAGFEVRLAGDTHIYGSLAPGWRVQVRGQIVAGVLTAGSLTVEGGGPPQIPTATPTATSAPTPTATGTPTTRATRTAIATSSPPPSATATPRPSTTPTAAPTIVPTSRPTLAPSPLPPAPTSAPSPAPPPTLIPPTPPVADDENSNENRNNNDNDNDGGGNDGDDNENNNDDNSGHGGSDDGDDDNSGHGGGDDGNDDNSGHGGGDD